MNNLTGFCDSLAQSPQFLAVVLQQPSANLLTLFASLGTPIIASLGIIIACGQLRTARHKLKIDLYEKRLIVYEASRKALGDIMIDGKTSNEIERQFLLGISGAKWLFNRELEEYLHETLWEEIIQLGTLQSQLDGLGRGSEKSGFMKKRSEIISKLNKHLNELDDKFYSFMHL
jgi:hypothetical protein